MNSSYILQLRKSPCERWTLPEAFNFALKSSPWPRCKIRKNPEVANHSNCWQVLRVYAAKMALHIKIYPCGCHLKLNEGQEITLWSTLGCVLDNRFDMKCNELQYTDSTQQSTQDSPYIKIMFLSCLGLLISKWALFKCHTLAEYCCWLFQVSEECFQHLTESMPQKM